MSRGRGGIFNLVGQGVGLVAEYRQHRQSQQLARENSQPPQHSEVPEVPADVDPSASPSRQASSDPLHSNEPPPSYDQVTDNQPPFEDASAQNLSLTTGGRTPVNTSNHNLNSYLADPHDPTFLIQYDEEYWELDEIVPRRDSELPGPLPKRDGEAGVRDDDDNDDESMQNRATSEQTHTVELMPREALPCPVIIPQRRPGSRARGFVRAYAPALQGCGISQETFLKFLKDFDKSSQASPIFTVISISAAAVSFVPSVTAIIVATIVQVAAQAGAQVQGRKRTNDCLDRINEEIFRPAGLFVFIMKYKPDQASSSFAGNLNSLASLFGLRSQTVDLSTNQIIAKYNPTLNPAATTEHSALSHQLQSLRLASGTTQGAAALPISVPLIFPDVDAAVRQEGDEAFKDKVKDAKKFLAGYIDRRAQNKYAETDPDSALVMPEEQRAYQSQYTDPNHPMFNNGLVGFVSGGKLTPGRTTEFNTQQGRSDSRRGQRDDDGRYVYRDEATGSHTDRGFRGRHGGSGGFLRGRGGRSGGLIGGLIGLASNAVANRGSGSSAPVSSQTPTSAAAHGGQLGSNSRVSSSTAVQPEDYDHDRAMGSNYGYEGQAGGGRGMRVGYGNGGRGKMQQGRGSPLGMVKKVMKEDVLYLMIVNMPSEAELEEARQALGALQSSQHQT